MALFLQIDPSLGALPWPPSLLLGRGSPEAIEKHCSDSKASSSTPMHQVLSLSCVPFELWICFVALAYSLKDKGPVLDVHADMESKKFPLEV